MASASKINHEGQLGLESSFLRVPFEQLKRSNRSAFKLLDREMTAMTTTLAEIPNGNPEAALRALDVSIERLERLKRRLATYWFDQESYCSRTRTRIRHLMELQGTQSADSEKFKSWSKTKLNRLLVDYMMRSGFMETAQKLSTDTGITDLVDLELFKQAQIIEEALRRHDCSACLAWCFENRSNLRKTKSKLEFSLRLQEFIEHARAGRRIEAIDYARKYFGGHSDTHIGEIQQVMGLLAFSAETQTEPYRSLYDSSRWDGLTRQFRADNYAMNCLTRQPLLILTLQAGLAALKTPACYEESNRNSECPVCLQDTYNVLADGLPKGHHVNSCLVCRITGDIMDEDNPPMVFPNGNVYSQRACEEMAIKNMGKVTCPRTGEIYTYNQLRRMFVT